MKKDEVEFDGSEETGTEETGATETGTEETGATETENADPQSHLLGGPDPQAHLLDTRKSTPALVRIRLLPFGFSIHDPLHVS